MILSKIKNEKGFILDGFPRNVAQAEALNKELPLDLVLNLTQKDDILIKKIESRRACQHCGRGYNLADIKIGTIHMPPLLPKVEGICDDCGGKLIQREDDKLEVVQSRLELYKKSTFPLVEYYTKKGILKNFPVIGGVKELLPSLVKLMKE
jgi:adenylate kinase